MNPNKQQEKLINNTEGFLLVDAGAGTGKTFSITERYINILNDCEPEDIFLATFTRNAADEMGDRIAEKTSYSYAEIKNSPISTFHSHCQNILKRHGFHTPKILGIKDEIDGIETLESKIREQQHFEEFYEDFKTTRPEYSEYYMMTEDSSELLGLLKSLASRGIIPREDDWYLNSEKHLNGDSETFKQLFNDLNRPQKSESGNKTQSKLKKKIYSYKYKNLPETAPSYFEIAGDRSSKRIRRDFCKKSFEEDREKLKDFIQELYFNYLKHCLSNGYLNFSFIMALTYVTLYENDEVREDESFDYIMIDEFQDTNEIQLKISVLLASNPNLCVVGDWKQSIYSFQYADVDNIKYFESGINSIIDELNSDKERISFRPDKIIKIDLKTNYRSSQKILDAAEQAFTLKGNKYEEVSKPDIVSLSSETQSESSEVKKLLCEDEKQNVLAKIESLTEEYNYSDIAVVSRTRRFGLKLQEEASKLNIPAAYEGGIELFNSSEAKLLLAWLRALNGSKKGWAVILERTGYSLREAEKILEEEEIPENLVEFRDELREYDLEGQLRKIFELHGYENPVTEKLIDVVLNTYSSSFMTTTDLIKFFERNIEENEIYEVDNTSRKDSVTVQTIHSAKGLEYPVVIIADVNHGVFPSYSSGGSSITYDDILGIRKKKALDEETGYLFDNWKYAIASKCVGGKYDEERRLMYVAMTRAEEKLYISAEKDRESRFYTGLDLEEEEFSLIPDKRDEETEEENPLKVEEPESKRRRLISTTEDSNLSDQIKESFGDGKELHKFMEEYIEEGKRPETQKEKELAEKIDEIDGSLESEVSFVYPDEDFTYTGRADLVAVKDNELSVMDLKTGDELLENYDRQLEIYEKAFGKIYSDKRVEASIIEI